MKKILFILVALIMSCAAAPDKEVNVGDLRVYPEGSEYFNLDGQIDKQAEVMARVMSSESGGMQVDLLRRDTILVADGNIAITQYDYYIHNVSQKPLFDIYGLLFLQKRGDTAIWDIAGMVAVPTDTLKELVLKKIQGSTAAEGTR